MWRTGARVHDSQVQWNGRMHDARRLCWAAALGVYFFFFLSFPQEAHLAMVGTTCAWRW